MSETEEKKQSFVKEPQTEKQTPQTKAGEKVVATLGETMTEIRDTLKEILTVLKEDSSRVVVKNVNIEPVAASPAPVDKLSKLKSILAPHLLGENPLVIILETNKAYNIKFTRQAGQTWTEVAKLIGNRSEFNGKWISAGKDSCFEISK